MFYICENFTKCICSPFAQSIPLRVSLACRELVQLKKSRKKKTKTKKTKTKTKKPAGPVEFPSTPGVSGALQLHEEEHFKVMREGA